VAMGEGSGNTLGWSVELCGGTHVKRTGDIGFIAGLTDSGVAAGVRRLEALAGHAARHHVNKALGIARHAATELKVSFDEIPARIAELMSIQKRPKQRRKSRRSTLGAAAPDLAMLDQFVREQFDRHLSIQDPTSIIVYRADVFATDVEKQGAAVSQLEERYHDLIRVYEQLGQYMKANFVIDMLLCLRSDRFDQSQKSELIYELAKNCFLDGHAERGLVLLFSSLRLAIESKDKRRSSHIFRMIRSITRANDAFIQ